jgi:hypothetical protein
MGKLAHSTVPIAPNAAPAPQRRRTDRFFLSLAARFKTAILPRGAEAFVKREGGQDRLDGGLRPSGITLMRASTHSRAQAHAVSDLVAGCTRDLESNEPSERDTARALLVRLAVDCGHRGAKAALESNMAAAICDFNLPTLLFLGEHAQPKIAAAVDTALEHNMGRLESERHLNTLAYIAAGSSCSRDAKLRAAAILVDRERRIENLEYVERSTTDLEIRRMMGRAITERSRPQ